MSTSGGFGRRFLFVMTNPRGVDRWLSPAIVFFFLDVFAGVAVAPLAILLNVNATQWALLVSVSIATVISIGVWDRGHWPLGFSGPPIAALRELLFGAACAALIILFADGLIALFAQLRHTRGNGIPWRELLVVYTPAAVHEELLFRGYAYQKIRGRSRVAAIAALSILFAAAHLGNSGISPLAAVNLVIAGVLLALAYELYERLWFPIGLHLAWNVVSGPLIGYPVSGFVSNPTLFVTHVSGPAAITGGAFGIEGSIAVTVAELLAIGWLLWRMYDSRALRAPQENRIP